MPYNPKYAKSRQQYQATHYFSVRVLVLPKDVPALKAAAANAGLSVGAYARAAIIERMERDGLPPISQLQQK